MVEKKKEVIKDPKVKAHPATQSHEEIHPHVNPHTEPKEIPKGTYHHDKKHEETPPLKSRFRLDWIWTKIRIGKFYPIPIVTILLIGLPMIPLILAAVGVPLPDVTKVPMLQGIFEFLNIYSMQDLFVVSTWVIWWPIFILTILIFKRIWCGGFCPFGLMTDIGNFFGKKLRKGEQPKPINIVKYIFIGFFIFKALGYLHDAIGITNSVVLTAEFLIFFLVFSFTIGMIAPRRTFCRVFCFLGSLPHLFGRLSFFTLETDRSKCVKCEGQWCLRGHSAPPEGITTAREPLLNVDGCPMFINIPQLSHTESNRNCILCGNCVKNCPHDAIHYKPKVPGYELYKGIDLNMHETVFVLGLIPLLAMFIAIESGLLGQFATALKFAINYHWAITGLYYLLAIVVAVFFYYIICGLGSVIMHIDMKLVLRNSGYIYLPFAYMAMIRDITLTYMFKGSFLPVQYSTFHVVYPFFDVFLMLVGATWSIYMAKKITEVTLKQTDQELEKGKILTMVLIHTAAIFALTYYWIGLMFPEYMVTLSEFNIWYTMPFIFSGVIIGGFILIVRMVSKRKKEAPQAQTKEELLKKIDENNRKRMGA